MSLITCQTLKLLRLHQLTPRLFFYFFKKKKSFIKGSIWTIKRLLLDIVFAL